jgi:ABC-2 type transport system permease protein
VAEPLLIVAKVIPAPPAGQYLMVAVGAAPVLGTLLTAIIAGDSISQDFSRQGLFTLSQPLGRVRIMTSRFLAALVVSAGLVLFFLLASAAFSEAFNDGLIANYWEMVAFSVVYTAPVVAFVMMFSALFRNPAIAIVAVAFFLFIGATVITGLLESSSVEPWFLLTYASQVITDIVIVPYPPHALSGTLHLGAAQQNSSNIYQPTPLEAVTIMAAYLVGSLTVCSFAYSRKELKEI